MVTDLGRFRGPRFGLPVNGALDQFSARAANILAGNEDNDPLMEITALDFRMRTDTDILIAVTGAPVTLTVGGRTCPQWEPVSVRAGETLAVRGMTGGLRAYLAIHGSVEAPVLLGSCAPDTVVGFGLQLAEGTNWKSAGAWPRSASPTSTFRSSGWGLTAPRSGPSSLWTSPTGRTSKSSANPAGLLFTSRIRRQRPQQPHRPAPRRGTSGTAVLKRRSALPRRSGGRRRGPSREELLVLHRGRGVTAGYPVLAVVTSPSLDVLAQARPGHTVTFRKTTVAEARRSPPGGNAGQLENLRAAVSTVFGLLGIGCQPQLAGLAPAAGS